MHPNRVFSPIRQSQRSMRPPCRPFICSAIHSNPQARLSRSLFSPSSHHLQVPLLEALLPGWCFLSVHGEAKVQLIPTQILPKLQRFTMPSRADPGGVLCLPTLFRHRPGSSQEIMARLTSFVPAPESLSNILGCFSIKAFIGVQLRVN